MNRGIFEIIGFENPDLSDLLRKAFKKQGALITSLKVEPLSAPMTGDHLMQATVVANLPDDVSLRTAEHAIEDISPDLNVVHLNTFSILRSGKNQMSATVT